MGGLAPDSDEPMDTNTKAYIQNKNKKKALETVNVLEETINKYNINNSLNISARVFFYSTNNRLDIYLNDDQYDDCRKLIEERNKEFEKFKLFIGKPLL